MRVVYLPEAREELLAAVEFYLDCEDGEDGLATDFYRELQKAVRDIIEAPELWGSIGKGFRRKLMHRFPFGVIYHLIDADVIEIVAVAHQKRRPGYWSKRDY